MKKTPLQVAAIALISAVFTTSVWATDPIAAGQVSHLSFRAGYAMFRVIGPNGSNACQPCPGDPAAMSGGGYCWISQADQSKLALILMARGSGAMISGRVTDLATNCTVYQLTLQD